MWQELNYILEKQEQISDKISLLCDWMLQVMWQILTNQSISD